MMRVLTTVVVILLMLPNDSTAQHVVWAPGKPLVWENFIGEVDRNNPYHALTQSGVQYLTSWEISNGNVTFSFTVFAYFDKKKSWVKQGKATDRLLSHEQVHFDIAELHARLLRKVLSEYTFTHQHDQEVQELFQENTAARDAMQDLYDEETDHMRDTTAQQRWEEYVRTALESLSQFDNDSVINKRERR